MNLASTISLLAGGLGSGCKGPNCGRPKKEYGFIGNADNGVLKELGKLPLDPDKDSNNPGKKMDSFWVAPNGDVYRESALLGPGFHEHWEHAYALMKKDPKEFDWIARASKRAEEVNKEKDGKVGFGWKYSFVDGLTGREGAIRAYAVVGSKAHWEAGISVGDLNEKIISRIQTIVDSMPVDTFRLDWWSKGDAKEAEGSSKEVMREVRKSFYQS